ncbi:NAD-dependent epimerase/dehydratase family protein [Salinibacterium sp. SWN248]|uniref:NAD-dependent epimerase/dehydratase family protein n=1 Tax=Salinibacterium sp. SWN248 TaxID=2792056 RepID=UPI0018CD3C7E|nr:NAD-dependent epimerase/dehydratase family protein [Salinibacterium sp. SWN248]MBH0023348.1 NAD-dependent epimerase/dehydratase family protein [Salinibacterium sp. SWN248]
MTVVIAGCGDLGIEAGLRFAALGRSVLGLRRSVEKLPPEIAGQSIDLSAHVPTLPADTSVVVIAVSPDERTRDGYLATYVDSVRNIAAAIERDCAAAPRVIYVSSTAVYGVSDGSWVDESTPATPASPTAIVLREAEALLLESVANSTILRLAGIYGPGRTRQIDRIREGNETLALTPYFTNLIHRDDAAAAIVHLATMATSPASIYLGVDDEPADQREVIGFLARSIDRPVPPPKADDGANDGRGRGKRCRNDRLKGTGFSFVYPSYREGYAAVLRGLGTLHR